MVGVALLGLEAVDGHSSQACDVVLRATCTTATAVALPPHGVAIQAAPVVAQPFVPVQQQVIVQQHAFAIQAFASPLVVQPSCVNAFASSAVRVRNVQRVRPRRVRSFSFQRSIVR